MKGTVMQRAERRMNDEYSRFSFQKRTESTFRWITWYSGELTFVDGSAASIVAGAKVCRKTQRKDSRTRRPLRPVR